MKSVKTESGLTQSLHRQQTGLALIEALMASAVLGIGLVGAMQLTLKAIYMASENRQHTTAQQLDQEGMDCLLAKNKLCPLDERITLQGVSYKRQASSTARSANLISDLQVSVEWHPAGGLSSTPVPAAVRRIDWYSSVSALPGWVAPLSPTSLLP
ncbi:MAG: type IV pilus modification PilV family protein [Rhodoferax sp.]